MAIERCAIFALSIAFTASLILYPDLPPDIPPRRDGPFVGGLFVAFFLPTAAAALWWILGALNRAQRLTSGVVRARAVTMLFLSVFHVIMLWALIGDHPWLARVLAAIVGLFLVVTGNDLPRTRPTMIWGVSQLGTPGRHTAWLRRTCDTPAMGADRLCQAPGDGRTREPGTGRAGGARGSPPEPDRPSSATLLQGGGDEALDVRGREARWRGSVPHHRVSDRRDQGRRSNMAEVKVFHDREGQTLTVWFTDPSLEYVSEETGDEVVLMKDRSGRVIGFEKLNFSLPDSDPLHVALETAPA